MFGLTLAAAATTARAGEAGCWFENGVVVVPAEVLGVAGDFILDTGAPQTLLAKTQAEAAGFAETALKGELRLAGVRRSGLAVAVETIDVRTGLFPTPIAGVIGADALRDYVVDVSFAPCRLALWPARRAPRFGAATRLPIHWLAGRPSVPASVSDGPRTLSGDFAVATGSDTVVRVADGLAAAPGAAKPRELYPYGVLRPRLRALSVAGRLGENLPAGLIQFEDPALAGEIGAPLLWRFKLRFDFPAGRLLIRPRSE
jgi:hypothetical protein